MPYYVVNIGSSRTVMPTAGTGTHIMKSATPTTPIGLAGGPKTTLCGRRAVRYVDVFTPAEASCRECKKRWQIGAAADAAEAERKAAVAKARAERRAAMTPQQRRSSDRKLTATAAVMAVVCLPAGVGLGLCGWTVNEPCMRPYAECVGNGHFVEAYGGLALLGLAAVFGLLGLAAVVGLVRGLTRLLTKSDDMTVADR
jgi:hypothetical protein